MELTIDDEIEASKSIFTSSYDLASGGIPPHVFLLEELASGRPLNDYAQRTFLALNGSNLLSIPGITIYMIRENRAEAVAYFGEELEQRISVKKKVVVKMAAQGGTAAIRQFLLPGHPLNYEPMSLAEMGSLLNEALSKGYISQLPELTDHRQKQYFGFMEFLLHIHSIGGSLTKDGLDASGKCDAQWFTEPFLSRGIQLHIAKLDLMVLIFGHAIEKMQKLGFADKTSFSPSDYFTPSAARIDAAAWNASFQKYFGRSVPSADGLLAWAKDTLAVARQNYAQTVTLS